MKPYTAQEIESSMADSLFRKAFGPDWQRIKERGALDAGAEFQKDYGFETPVAIHGWQWSTTFGQWGALVTFANGWRGYTYPKLF